MVDVFLIIICIVFTVLCLFIGLYMVVQFQMDTEEHSWFSKIIVMLALGCSAMNVLLLPLDALNRNSGTTLKIDIMCWIFTIASAALAFIVVPFTMKFYENSIDEDVKHPLCKSFFGLIPSIIFIVVFFLILYFIVGQCEVPLTRHAGVLVEKEEDLDIAANINGRAVDSDWNITPSAITYFISMLGFIGYLLLIVFGGIGFATLPLNLFQDFNRRPKPINLKTYARARSLLNQWSNELIEEGKKILEEGERRGFKTRKVKKEMAKLEEQVKSLERAYQVTEVSYKVRGGNPVVPWLKLILGIFCVIISILWIIHIVIYTIFDLHPFLNQFFHILDQHFALSAVIFFGVFTYYLYWCTLSGVCTFGLNFFIFKAHPMEKGNTPMTSILFNSIIMLFSSFGCALFATINFPIYTRLTSLSIVYGVQVRLLVGLKYVWEYGIYAFLGFFVISLVVRLCTCTRKKDDRQADINQALCEHDVEIVK
jgi:hypothetical protein